MLSEIGISGTRPDNNSLRISHAIPALSKVPFKRSRTPGSEDAHKSIM